jgi:hypothetical protein
MSPARRRYNHCTLLLYAEYHGHDRRVKPVWLNENVASTAQALAPRCYEVIKKAGPKVN